MADYVHIENLIQGEVLRIFERRHPDQWDGELEVLVDFLGAQRQKVLLEKIKAADQLRLDLPEPDHETASQSAVEEDQL